MINRLNKLEVDGLLIKTSEGIKKVYFVLGLVVGDNLDLNCILEFDKSFSANYFCRFCKIKKKLLSRKHVQRICYYCITIKIIMKTLWTQMISN